MPFCCLRKNDLLAVDFQKSTRPPISRLSCWRSPLTVLGFIVSFVVFAIDCVHPSWFFPHVGKEVLKRGQPPLANRDSASAVFFKCWIIFVRTSLNHFRPRLILRRSASAVRSMNTRLTSLVVEAPAARLPLATLKACKDAGDCVSAVTQTNYAPRCIWFARRFFYYNQPPEPLSSYPLYVAV